MLNVTLEEDVKKLDEVVVVGYSVQKKKDITGAVSTVLAKDIENIPVNDFGSALAGRSAGVQVITFQENQTKVSLFVSGERRLSMRETNLCTWWMECRPVTRKPLTLPK